MSTPADALTSTSDAAVIDRVGIWEALNRDGIIANKGAFSRDWVQQLREDVDTAYAEARGRENGAVGRGPHRWYVEIHPEALRGFVDLADHPWVRAVCETMLGPDYQIVEVGFDVPEPGAINQPWHRDFPSPQVTRQERRLNSLAFNVTTVDTDEDMGPFEIAPTTQWETGEDFDHEMFPDRSNYPRYEALAVRKYPQMGDISARTALTIHRGTINHSDKSRPVLVLGVDAPGAGNDEHHDLAVTRGFWESLPDRVRAHLSCPVVDELTPITQKHTIEGLVMGDAEG
ncbi:MAG: phytanoyl-CoA dioxygenase family protein [Nocardioidaceae bacterium]|nr:phytanoyl-CoA dioxygenase family protein [Nocardioidaceae bacterium]